MFTSEKPPPKYSEFIYKRLSRIYPLHALTFIIWCFFFFSAWGNTLQDKLNSGIANILLIQAFFSGPLYNLGYNAVSWTISVEMFFYLLFPFLRDPKVLGLLLFIYFLVGLNLSTTALQAINEAVPDFFFFNPIARISEFMIGILAYEVFKKLPSLRVATLFEGLAIVLLLVVVREKAAISEQFLLPSLGLVFALTIVIFAKQQGLVSKALAQPLPVILGEASYALYLIHHMWFRIVQDLLGKVIVGWELLLIAVFSAIALSILLHYAYERPLRTLLLKRKHYRSNLI